MRIKRDVFSLFSKFHNWFFIRFKPLTVHTEAIMIDSVWEEVKQQSLRGKVHTWYVMTPENIEYYRSFFNVKMSKQKLSNILKKRYLWMIKHNQKIELHIHLSLIMDNITYKEQETMFKNSIKWMQKELNITPKEFVPGWWSYNEDTLKILEKLNIKMITERDYDFTHDYYFLLNFVRTKN